jgi:hypothetical protein
MVVSFHLTSRMDQCRTPTDAELVSLPHIIMTSDVDWNPSKFDNDIANLDVFDYPIEDDNEEYHFDQHGEYHHCTIAAHRTCTEEDSMMLVSSLILTIK